MGKKENKKIKEILLNLPSNKRLFRINSGMGWTASPAQTLRVSRPMVVKVVKGDIVLRQGRPFHGAPEGFPDLCGWETIEITSDMIGQKIAIFIGEEVKVTGSLSKAQKSFQKLLTKMGGIFRVIKS